MISVIEAETMQNLIDIKNIIVETKRYIIEDNKSNSLNKQRHNLLINFDFYRIVPSIIKFRTTISITNLEYKSKKLYKTLEEHKEYCNFAVKKGLIRYSYVKNIFSALFKNNYEVKSNYKEKINYGKPDYKLISLEKGRKDFYIEHKSPRGAIGKNQLEWIFKHPKEIVWVVYVY